MALIVIRCESIVDGMLPCCVHTWTSVTMEKLHENLVANKGSLIHITDEFSGVFNGLNQYKVTTITLCLVKMG